MDKIQEFGDKAFDFVMSNFDDPFFWIGLLVVMLVFTFGALKSFDK